MQDIYITHFPNQGFLNTRLTEEQLRPVVAEIEEVKVEDCLNSAYNVIKNRKGKSTKASFI